MEQQIAESKETLKSIEDTYKSIDEVNAIPVKKSPLTETLQITTQEALRRCKIAQDELKQWKGGLSSEIVKTAQNANMSMREERAKYGHEVSELKNQIKLAEYHLRKVPKQNEKYKKDLSEYGLGKVKGKEKMQSKIIAIIELPQSPQSKKQ